MSDAALQNAVALRDQLSASSRELGGKIAELASQKAEAEARLAKVEAFISDWRVFADGGPPAPEEADVNAAPVGGVEDRKRGARAPGKPKREIVAAQALDIIRNNGRPIQRAELYEALKGRGVLVTGNDPLVTFSTMLWRMKPLIMHLQGFGFWDPALPYAEANYDPGAKARDADDKETPEDKEMPVSVVDCLFA